MYELAAGGVYELIGGVYEEAGMYDDAGGVYEEAGMYELPWLLMPDTVMPEIVPNWSSS